MEKQFPRFFNFVILFAAWHTYHIVGALFWGGLDLSGGGVFPNAWVIPLSQDTLTGLLAPVVVYLTLLPKTVQFVWKPSLRKGRRS
jgi:hypothetical protein